MTDKNIDTKYVCHCCVGDQILATEIEEKGASKECSYCGDSREAFGLDALADRIHEVIEEHFESTSGEPNWLDNIMIREGILNDWYPEGQRAADIIADIAGLSEEIAKDLTDRLSGRFRYRAIKEGGEDPYDSAAYYEERSPYDGDFRYSWRAFRSEIMYQERFFPRNAGPVLDDIFRDLRDLKTYDGTPVIREVAPGDEDFSIWRARTAQSNEELTTILKCPARQLGSPPSSFAEAGRMNVKGVSVFYGAMDQCTCLSEVRPPVGSNVVIGRFELLRQVRLLDLGVLSKIDVDASYFDPNYAVLKDRAAFLRHLVSEISRPVMPRDMDREYLPTQFVASYLAHKVDPQLDGIIFPSSQTEGKGQNLVLFNHARGVEPYSLPAGSDLEVYIPLVNEEDDIIISETVPSNPPEEEPETGKGQRGPIRLFLDDEPEEQENHITPTLKLEVESVEVFDIKGVTYTSNSRTVTRHWQTTEERDNFNLPVADVDLDSLPDMRVQETSEGQP